MINLSKIAASVTLYNSSITSLECIETYRIQVSKLYVVDNSDRESAALVKHLISLPNVVYLSNNGNKGVASALNRAASVAINDGFDFLLTMDDDTSVPTDLIVTIVDFLDHHIDPDYVGIVTASHTRETTTETFRSVLTTMTSGNLLNLSVYARVGPFRDDFFIDHVDHEYGLRLNKANFQVIELLNLQVDHRLGERKLVGWELQSYVSHAPMRGYYIVRNGVVLVHEYGVQFPEFKRRIQILLMKEFVKALFFESKKLYRLRLLWRGLADGRAGRLGKLTE